MNYYTVEATATMRIKAKLEVPPTWDEDKAVSQMEDYLDTIVSEASDYIGENAEAYGTVEVIIEDDYDWYIGS